MFIRFSRANGFIIIRLSKEVLRPRDFVAFSASSRPKNLPERSPRPQGNWLDRLGASINGFMVLDSWLDFYICGFTCLLGL